MKCGSFEQIMKECEDDIAKEDQNELLNDIHAIYKMVHTNKRINTEFLAKMMPMPNEQPGIIYYKDIKTQAVQNMEDDIENAFAQKIRYDGNKPKSAGDLEGLPMQSGALLQHTPTMTLRLDGKFKKEMEGIEYQILEAFKAQLFQKGGAKMVAEITPQMEKDILTYIRKNLLTEASARPKEMGLFKRSGQARRNQPAPPKTIGMENKVVMSTKNNELFKDIYMGVYRLKSIIAGGVMPFMRRVRPDEFHQLRTRTQDIRVVKKDNALIEKIGKFQRNLAEREAKKKRLHLITSPTRLVNAKNQLRNFGKEIAGINDCEE